MQKLYSQRYHFLDCKNFLCRIENLLFNSQKKQSKQKKAVDFMTFFSNCKTLEELKKAYKKLAIQYHPDNGGSTATMQAINAEYTAVFEILKNQHNATADAKYQTRESAKEFMDAIEKIIFCDGLEIEICGTWIWVTGKTYQHKDTLKEAGFKWCNNKKAWVWHSANDGFTANRKRKITMSEIRFKYGSEKVETKARTALA